MRKLILLTAFILLTLGKTFAQEYIEQNQPTVDFKRLHYGFSIGLNSQNLLFSHVDQSLNSQQWYAEIPSLNPGFSVGLVSDLSLGRYFNLRFNPGLHFGSKGIVMREFSSNTEVKQDLKSNYLYLPLEIKYSSLRLNNSRPYLMFGGAVAYDLAGAKGDTEYLRLNPMDFYLEVGVGCDIYYNYFKLIPELKFCFGLANVLDKQRSDLEIPTNGSFNPKTYTQALSKAASRLIVLTFYFE
ncbi:MAG: porin family protein [Bacteroidales bacterium]|nr:porin family protein [Bacteroidales bacterium]